MTSIVLLKLLDHILGPDNKHDGRSPSLLILPKHSISDVFDKKNQTKRKTNKQKDVFVHKSHVHHQDGKVKRSDRLEILNNKYFYIHLFVVQSLNLTLNKRVS